MNMKLNELIEVDACDLKTAETALWYIKVIKDEIYDSFMKETIKEYKDLFQHVYIEKADNVVDNKKDLFSLEKLMI